MARLEATEGGPHQADELAITLLRAPNCQEQFILLEYVPECMYYTFVSACVRVCM